MSFIIDCIYCLICLPFNVLLYCITSKTCLIAFAVWSVICFFGLRKIFKSIQKYVKADKSLYEKYPDFMRSDWKYWSFTKLYLGAVLFSWIKLFGVFMSVIGCFIAVKFVTRGKSLDNVDDKLRNKLKSIAKFIGSMFTLSCGIVISKEKVDADYSEYLGENYKKENDANKKEFAAIISNHVSWLDILICMSQTGGGFITSIAVKSFPIVGFVCTWLGSIYVDRVNKDDRNASLMKVEEKLTNIYTSKENSDLCIFPEGTTTNGSVIIPFKKGAFTKLYPLKPFVIVTDVVNNMSLAMDIIEMVSHIIIVCCVPIHYVKIVDLPIFKPNAYFSETYAKSKINDDKKQVWGVYSDVMRDIMCKYSGLKKGTLNYDHKREVLDILRGTKKEK